MTVLYTLNAVHSGNHTTASGTLVTAAQVGSFTPHSIMLVAIASINTTVAANTFAVAGGSGTMSSSTLVTKSSSTRRIDLLSFDGFTDPYGACISYANGQSSWLHVVYHFIASSSSLEGISGNPSAGNTATSTTPDTNSITPNIDDFIFAGFVASANNASSARTDTGNTYTHDVGVGTTNLRLETSVSIATAAASSKQQWTITSAEWAATEIGIPLASPPSTLTGLLMKGRKTATEDAAAGG